MDPIFEFIGKVIAIGGSSAIIAYGIFTLVGRKWLETKFAERLEAYKHEQTKELEEIRYRINAQFNRITKFMKKKLKCFQKHGFDSKNQLASFNTSFHLGANTPI
jgi:hypothetical protein